MNPPAGGPQLSNKGRTALLDALLAKLDGKTFDVAAVLEGAVPAAEQEQAKVLPAAGGQGHALILFDVQNRKFGPYLITVNRILIAVMALQ
jgi:hypothetical protein